MKELLDILQQAQKLETNAEPYALATVIKIGGSTYRRPGARMLIADAGRRWGAISGGCLEGEVAQQALFVLESGKPRVIPFDLQDDDIVLGFGTGCNGIVHVLIQPIEPTAQASPVHAFQHIIKQRKQGILATVVACEPAGESLLGQHLLWCEDGTLGPSTLPAAIHPALSSACQEILAQDESSGQMYLWHTRSVHSPQGALDVLFEIVRPPVDLQIYGEGHDVHAVVSVARTLGWHVQVIGRKPAEVLADRFPGASACRFLMHPESVRDHIAADRRAAALVMNHTYVRDKTLMRALLDSDIAYVGAGVAQH
jgi:xanthine/CO dehydrogenase XdhC/CoxF family maturation factor